jgi:putative heme-binding domain-containing protein
MDAIAAWSQPMPRDLVLNLWRPVPARPTMLVTDVLAPAIDELLAARPTDLVEATARAAGKLRMQVASPGLLELVRNDQRPGSARAAALEALAELQHPELATVANLACAAKPNELRKTAVRILAQVAPQQAAPILDALVSQAAMDERQNALATLGRLDDAAADPILARWLERYRQGELPPELHLELNEAIERRGTRTLLEPLQTSRAAVPAGDRLARWRDALHGGSRSAGSKVFWEHDGANCMRCHQVNKDGGIAGPPLTHIGSRRDREHLLASLVDPQAEVAEGYGSVFVEVDDGADVLAGILRREDERTITLQPPDGPEVVIEKTRVRSRTQPVSAMLPMNNVLTKRELRDLVEYLASLQKQKPKAEAGDSEERKEAVAPPPKGQSAGDR